MNKSEMQRLIKIEDRIYEIAKEDGLDFCDIEFDIIPDQKMLEIMSYRVPGNISNWKYGRDYEKLRTFQEKVRYSLPFEMVINSNPSRAYIMKNNTFAIQVLVMAHVVGHVAFFTMNQHFQRTKRDIINYLSQASKRFNKYERLYGVDEVEKIIDAGHSIQFHCNPFDTETEDEKRERIFKQMKIKKHIKSNAEFADITAVDDYDKNKEEDIALQNQKIWKKLKLKTPVEPTEDLLRYIIDKSKVLENWQKDILEVLRQEGEYFWPQMRTPYMNEGFATLTHERIIKKLFKENLLTVSEHAQFNYTNSLVKAMNPKSMNPYLVGSRIWEDVIDRWNKGKHGFEYENCNNQKEKNEWDDGSMKGREKMFEIIRSHTDWFFMQNFLTPELINDLQIYIYAKQESLFTDDWVITKQESKKIAKMIIMSFAHNNIPNIEIANGNFKNKGYLFLNHKWFGVGLDQKYCTETMRHIYNLWGNSIFIKTKQNKKDIIYELKKKVGK